MTRLIIGSASPNKTRKWADTPTVGQVVQKKRTRVAAPVNIELFEKSSELCDDPFWVDLLRKAQIGKFPSKFSYKDGMLQYKHTQKVNRQALSINPTVALTEFITFIQENGNIYSPADRKEEIKRRKERPLPTNITWGKLPNKQKIQSVCEFMRVERENKDLSSSEMLQLQYIMNHGFAMGYFHKNNIKLEMYTILEIKGLVFIEEERKYDIDTTIAKPLKSSSKAKPKVKKNYFDLWCAHHGENITENLRNNGKLLKDHHVIIKHDGNTLFLTHEKDKKDATTVNASEISD